jgi:hypothetical protein
MDRPSYLLKSFTDRLAQVVINGECSQVTRLLRLAGLVSPASTRSQENKELEAGSNLPLVQTNSDRVGIWKRKSENGKSYFVRCRDMIKEWGRWANVGRIGPKGAKKRIVLIGESVARGQLYDPLFTPAMALEKMLQSYLGEGEVDVVDLARTDLSLLQVKELALSAFMLEPDAVVIFAGNNWHNSFLVSDMDRIRSVTTLLREEGIGGLKRYAEEQLARSVIQLVKTISTEYEIRGIPLVWVIPEFNLGDWRDLGVNMPHLINGSNREWITYREAAEGARRNGDLNLAAEFAQKMIELDGGVIAAGLNILAEYSKRVGAYDEARSYLERARDSVIWDPSIRSLSPRSFSVVQETLREEVGKYRGAVVDLRHLFRQYLKEEIPDYRLFLDYCHLTSEGIRIAVAGMGAHLLRLFKRVDLSWHELVDECASPPDEVEAEASFLAAVHNAHWGQSYDLVHHFCLRSVDASTKIAGAMIQFIEMQTRRAPILICRSAEEIAKSGSAVILQYLLRYNYQHLDRLLLDAVVSSLKKIGINVQEKLDRLRLEEHSVTTRDIDLLDDYYCPVIHHSTERKWAKSSKYRLCSDYYKAFWLESPFVFVGEACRPVGLLLTCRLPSPGLPEGNISIEINGSCLGQAMIGNKWETLEIAIAAEMMRDGLNDVVIRWPTPKFTGREALEIAADDLVDGVFPQLFPVYGEIHSFTAVDGNKNIIEACAN